MGNGWESVIGIVGAVVSTGYKAKVDVQLSGAHITSASEASGSHETPLWSLMGDIILEVGLLDGKLVSGT